MAKLPKRLMRPVGRAIADYAMIRDRDRILLGLSGGKDSLSLLHILHQLQRHAPIRFELAAITVDPLVAGFDPSKLKPLLHELGIPYFYREEPILERARDREWNEIMGRGTSRPRLLLPILLGEDALKASEYTSFDQRNDILS